MNETPAAAPMREDITQAACAMLRRQVGDGEKGVSIVWGGNPDIPAHAAIAAIAEALSIAHSARRPADDGYATAFYEIATMLDIGAQAASPADVWRDQMRPKLEALTKNPSDAVRPPDETLDGFLPESVRSEKRCGIQRSAWLTGWYVPWSPRNDNENAEGPWSHWVALARAILEVDAKAIATAASEGVING